MSTKNCIIWKFGELKKKWALNYRPVLTHVCSGTLGISFTLLADEVAVPNEWSSLNAILHKRKTKFDEINRDFKVLKFYLKKLTYNWLKPLGSIFSPYVDSTSWFISTTSNVLEQHGLFVVDLLFKPELNINKKKMNISWTIHVQIN